MSEHPVPAWDGRSLADLMALDASGETTFRTRCGDANAHGGAYGGQLPGLALMAAARTAPAGRACTAMQFMFFRGTLWDEVLVKSRMFINPLKQQAAKFSATLLRVASIFPARRQ